jgi:CubicO group peptidase (beta-lactamase class C family)
MKKTNRFRNKIKIGLILFLVVVFLNCNSSETEIQRTIVPEQGYTWPNKVRNYWPTSGWKTASMQDHNINSSLMNLAHEFAQNDVLTRSLLVVKDGYIVFEQYYGEGVSQKSTNLWSVTKSFASVLVGILLDKGFVQDVDQLMVQYLSGYLAFGNISIKHTLTHTTGLSWSETGIAWVNWIMSSDWIAEALSRGQIYDPGEVFKYSSANSHFLSALIYAASGRTPGEFAQQHLFNPLGITFHRQTEIIDYPNWDAYKVPIENSWRLDPMGLEIGGFCLFLTARDMAKFGYLMINRGNWEGRSIVSSSWVDESTRDKITNIYGRYSYGFHWWITVVGGYPSFLASGWGGQIIGVIPALDLVVVIKYEAENPVRPVENTEHDDMHLFELVVNSVIT